MKIKTLFLTLASAMMLCSCRTYTIPSIMGNGGTDGNKSPEKEEEVAVPVNTYLVLSSIGLFNGEKGKAIEEKMLENAVIYNAKPGQALPTKENITTIASSSGEFDAWVCYEGTGFPTVYTTVPKEGDKILYATFKNTEGGDTPVDPSSNDKLTTIYLDATRKLNSDNDETWASGNAGVTMYTWSYTTGDSKYTKMTNAGNGYYSASVNLEKYTNVIFLRHANDQQPSFDEGGYWNKTPDLLFVADMNCFTITSWNSGGVWTSK